MVDIADSQSVESEFMVKSILGAVVASMQQLPLRMQVVLCLHYFVGKDLKDIAELLGEPEADVSAMHIDGVLAVHKSMVEAVGE